MHRNKSRDNNQNTLIYSGCLINLEIVRMLRISRNLTLLEYLVLTKTPKLFIKLMQIEWVQVRI